MRGVNLANRIRIIKRAAPPQGKESLAENTTPPTHGDEDKASRRDMAATVTRWVGELRERKDAETKQALRDLLRRAA